MITISRVLPLPDGIKSCPDCHGMPVFTEDPTDEGDGRFQLECGDHLWVCGATAEEALDEWNDDYDLIKLGADPVAVASRSGPRC